MREVFVGQVDLILGTGPGRRRLRRSAARLAARRLRLRRAGAHLRFMLGLLARKALLGPRLDLRLGRGDAGQALRAPGQLFRHRHPVRHIRGIGGLRQRHQLGDLGLQLRFELARMLIGQRAVPAGVGVDLGAVQRHRAQLEQPGLPRQHQDLDEQPFDLREKPAPERGDGVVVGMIVGGDEAERHRIVSGALELAAREHPRGVAVDQKPQQHARVIRGRARAAIGPNHRRKVEPLDHLHHKARQMPLRQPFVHRRRQQKPGLAINLAKVAHYRSSQEGRINPCHRIRPA